MHVIPRQQIRTIPRLRLFQALHAWQSLRLVRIVAPAGYGKSTFAAAWARSLAELPDGQRPYVAWMSLFEDVAPDRFLRTLVESLVGVRPALENLLSLDGSGEYSPAQRVRMLCDALNAAPAPVVLFIDDYHLLTQPTAHALIQQILDSIHGRFLLVLVSRTTPPLHIDRLILDDAVLTLAERDLAFDHDEFLSLVQLISMNSQPPELLEELEQRCTGWVTALKLLAHDLQYAPSGAATSLTKLSASSLQQFIEARILASLPNDLREFVDCAAHLPWMSAPLLAAATGAPEASCAHTLAHLVDSNAFVSEFASPAGEPRFRFHPLVQEALRRTAPDDPPARHRAAVWLCDHDLVDEALAVMEIDDGRRTTDDGSSPSSVDFLDSLARATRRALLRFDVVSARRWLDALPPPLFEAHALLALNAAWAAYFADDVPQFHAAFARAAAVLPGCTAGPLDPLKEELHLEKNVLEAYQHILHGRMNEAAQSLAAAENMPHSNDALGVGYLHFMRALVPHDPSDFDARARSLQSAADAFDHIGHLYGVIETQYLLMLLKRRYLDLPGALATSIFLEGFAESHKRSSHNYLRDNLMIRGEMLYMQNRIAEAREVMLRAAAGPAYNKQSMGIVFIARAYLALCDAAESADSAAALRSIDETADAAAWAQILELDFDATHGLAAWPRILRDYRAGRPERCRQTVESLRLTPADLTDQTHDSTRFSVLAGAVLGGHDAPLLAERLDALLAHANATHFRYMALHVRILRVLHALTHGDETLAYERLREALPDVERSGMQRLLLDHPTLQPLLHRCDDAFARRMLALYPAAPAPNPPDFALTEQEKRILAQLADGLSTKEIAAAFMVTHKTVYTHIHRIFKKLDVHSREEAVRVWQARA